MTPPEASHDEQSPVRRKSTLFCWGCDHESPADGDWIHRTTAHDVEYVCPVCETTIANRPLPETPTRERQTPSAAWHRTLRTAMTVWQAHVTIGVSSVTAVAACQPLYARP